MMRQISFALLLAMPLFFAAQASARNGGIYLEIAPSYGFFDAEELVIENGDDDGPLSPPNGFVPQLKFGVNLFGWAGAELDAAAFGWDLGNVDRGGGGFLGGVFRVTPLEILTYVIPETVELPSLMPAGPVNWKNRPFDLGVYVGGGFSIVGEDFAYQGGYVKWGFDLKFFLTPQFALGIDLPFRHTLYDPFRYSNYEDSLGYCTEGGKAFGAGGIEVPANLGRTPLEVSDSTDCNGPAPAGFLFSPAFTITGVFDFGI